MRMLEAKSWVLRRSVLGAAALLVAAGCSSTPPSSSGPRAQGESDFVSTSPGGGQLRTGIGTADAAGATNGATPPRAVTTTSTRAVEETDIYRLEGDRLYFLNGYRGLMVFDVS